MTETSQALSTSCESGVVLGRTEPRLWTPPLRELTRDTSYGYDLIDFAEAIGWPLDPYQQWLAIHGGELLPDGRPRFRVLLVIIARQNGKSVFCRILTLFWLFVDCIELVIGTNTSRDTAKASWRKVIEMAERTAELAADLAPIHTREAIGEENFFTKLGSNYRFAAPNRRAGRSLTVGKAILDELREHRNRDTWDALINAGNAVADFQAWAITNQGDVTAIVLDELRTAALQFLETGEGDPRLFLAEWSAPAGSDPADLNALAYANPDLGNRIQADALVGQALQAKNAGGETLARFRTEIMCQKVHLLDPAIEPELWDDCGTAEPVDLAAHRKRVALCFDVSLDGSHATLVAAATLDGVTHIEVVKRWQGHGCTAALRAELPGIVDRIKPRSVAWFPAGPAAAVAADLKQRRGGRRPWPPRGVKVDELTAETAAVCMGLADIVASGQLQHPKDEMLDQHIAQTQKLKRGDAWVFTRAGAGPVDGSYAAAGAAHAARTLPAPLAPLVVAT